MLLEFIVFLLILKVFVDVTKGKCLSRNGMAGKTVLLTGANSGIGMETARELAKRGARIIMASRNTRVSEKIRADIVNETDNKNIIVKYLDVSLRKSIREFVEDIQSSEEKIDVLIHNAGIGFSLENTVEHENLTLATNLFGPFLLTVLLMNLLKNAPSARVIFVSSLSAFRGKVDFAELSDCGQFPKMPKSPYSISKYGLILLAHEFTDRLNQTKVMVNTLHPGIVITPIWDYHKVGKFFVSLISFLCKSPDEGAQTTLHVAIDDVAGTVSGRFFVDCYQFSIFAKEEHRENGRVLWDKCEKIGKLTESDPTMSLC